MMSFFMQDWLTIFNKKTQAKIEKGSLTPSKETNKKAWQKFLLSPLAISLKQWYHITDKGNDRASMRSANVPASRGGCKPGASSVRRKSLWSRRLNGFPSKPCRCPSVKGSAYSDRRSTPAGMFVKGGIAASGASVLFTGRRHFLFIVRGDGNVWKSFPGAEL